MTSNGTALKVGDKFAFQQQGRYGKTYKICEVYKVTPTQYVTVGGLRVNRKTGCVIGKEARAVSSIQPVTPDVLDSIQHYDAVVAREQRGPRTRSPEVSVTTRVDNTLRDTLAADGNGHG